MTLSFGQSNDFRFYPYTQAGFQQAHWNIGNSVPVKIWGSEEVIYTSGIFSTYLNCWLVLNSHGRGCHRGLGSTSSSFWRERQPVPQAEGVKKAVPPVQRGDAAFPEQKWGLQLSQARLFKAWVALVSRHLVSA